MKRPRKSIRRRIVSKVRQRFHGRCAYCGNTDQDLTVDHAVALSNGGAHHYNNFLPACDTCNRAKGSLSTMEFRRMVFEGEGGASPELLGRFTGRRRFLFDERTDRDGRRLTDASLISWSLRLQRKHDNSLTDETNQMAIVFADVEVSVNYFLLLAYDSKTKRLHRWERHNDVEIGLHRSELLPFLKHHTIVGFNWLGFDKPMVDAYFQGFQNEQLFAVCEYLIGGGPLARWKVHRDLGIHDIEYRMLDVMPVAPGVASLKLYAARVGSHEIEDLVFTPGEAIDEDARYDTIDYCELDLRNTARIFRKVKPQLHLRKALSEKFGVDCMSKSDPQIAEAVLKQMVIDRGGTAKKGGEGRKNVYKYVAPGCVEFASRINRHLLMVQRGDFLYEKKGGEWKLRPPAAFVEPIEFAGATYRTGMGGLHSSETRRVLKADDEFQLFELDVTSYYPALILNNEWYPEGMGPEFTTAYRSIVEQRVKAKHEGDKVAADALKIVVNSSFGKFGSEYSVMFSPQLLLNTTITGQLCLLMLIEMLTLRTGNNCDVVSANTDGVLVRMVNTDEANGILQTVVKNWETRTGLTLERTDYSMMAQRDVNNYVGITTDGARKTKGIFNSPGLMKNPAESIVPEAVIELAQHGVPIEETIRSCRDLGKFVTAKKVMGGGVWRGQPAGKTVRWYRGVAGDPITYASNGNQVGGSENAVLVNRMPTRFPVGVDLNYYIERADELAENCGLYDA